MGVTSRPRGCVLHNTTSVGLDCTPRQKKNLVRLHKEAAEGGPGEDSMAALQRRLVLTLRA